MTSKTGEGQKSILQSFLISFHYNNDLFLKHIRSGLHWQLLVVCRFFTFYLQDKWS